MDRNLSPTRQHLFRSFSILLIAIRNPSGPGAFAFHNRWQLISPLKNVKWIKLLWARIPNANGSDGVINLHFSWSPGSSGTGTWGGAFPPRHAATTSTQFLDGTSNAFASLTNTTPAPFALNAESIFLGEDYHIEQYGLHGNNNLFHQMYSCHGQIDCLLQYELSYQMAALANVMIT